MKYKRILPGILIFAILFMTGCQNNQEPIKRDSFLMGTYIEIMIYDNISEDEGATIITKAFDRIQEIETKMTINNAETSEIIQLNHAGANQPVAVSSDTMTVLERGKYYSALSGGIFDITIGPLVKLWNIGTDKERVPSEQEIQALLPLVDYHQLILDPKAGTAALGMNGMMVDLGGIAKGYAADEVKKVLMDNGIKSAIISLGGNILTIGTKPDGEPWNIGIQDPFGKTGDYIGIIPESDNSIVSSGDYQRFFIKDGKKYHHILDPATGYPSNTELTGVTIISKQSIDGDGLSTCTFLLGLDKGMKFIEKQKDVEAVFITKDKKVYVTSGLKDKFKLTNKDFHLEK